MSDLVAQLELVSSTLGVTVDLDRAKSLVMRLGAEPCVAIMGLVSRGKSHLVNELIGQQLCPVGPLGETAATVRISAGAPLAWIVDENGQRVDVAPSPEALAARLPRRVSPIAVEGEFKGQVRLPDSVVIADTPGVDDAASVGARLAYLERHWLQAGSCGAVVVVSLPPGLGRTDASFIEEAQRIFDRNLVVAVKATDSSVPNADLHDVAEEVQRHLGITPVVISNDEPVGEWGSGKTGELDRVISRLIAKGRRSKDTDSEALADLVRGLCEVIRAVGSHHLQALEALSRRIEITSIPLARAIEDRRRELQNAAEAEVRQAREKAERERRRFLDSQADQLRRLLPKQLFSADRGSHAEVLNSVIELARDGSPAAVGILGELMACEPSVREKLGITVEKLASKLGVAALIETLGRACLSISELHSLVRLARSDNDRSEMLRRTTFLSQLATKPADEIASLVLEVKSSAMRSAMQPVLLDAMETSLPRALRRAATPTSTLQVYEIWNDLVPLINAVQEMSDSAGHREQMSRVASLLDSVVTRLFDRAVELLAEIERTATKDPAWLVDENHSGWVNAQLIEECAEAADWLRQNDVTDRVLSAFSPGGSIEQWVGEVGAAKARAVDDARRSSERFTALRNSSFVLWGISILMATGGSESVQGVSPLVWLASFVLWLSTRNRTSIPWKMKFVPPEYLPLRN